MVTCAIDLGKFNSVCCFFDPKTQKHEFETIATKRAHIEHLLDSRRDIDLVVMEACGPSGWINDICLEKKVKTLVCSTNEEAWSWKATKQKTDRDDALKLAEMSLLRRLVPVHVPKPRIRQQRAFIKYRKSVDHDINRLKNSIRSIFANRGIEIDTGARAWCTGRTHIDSFRKSMKTARVTNSGEVNSTCSSHALMISPKSSNRLKLSSMNSPPIILISFD